MSASLTLYRALVPAHAAVPSVTVERWLELAAGAHTPSALGTRATEVYLYWAAAQIESEVQAGMYPTDGSCDVEPVDPAKAQAPEDTAWWARYLRALRTRAAAAPRRVAPC